jgi:hypothetical protein
VSFVLFVVKKWCFVFGKPVSKASGMPLRRLATVHGFTVIDHVNRHLESILENLPVPQPLNREPLNY